MSETTRPPDVHSRLQDLVDTHFGVRPTTPIDGLLTILEQKLGDLLQDVGPPLLCSGCGEETDERHTWKECHAILKEKYTHTDE